MLDVKKLNEQLKTTETLLAESQARCKEMEAELKEAKQCLATYKQGLEVGKQVSSMMRGLMDGGLPEVFAQDLILSAIKAGMM